MEKRGLRDFTYYVFQNLSACTGVLHFVSSGQGSIGFSEEQELEVIRSNRKLLAKAVGFDANHLVTAQQVHSANVKIITLEDRGKGAMEKESRLPDTDALVTDQEDLCLMVLSADCVPVLLFDPVKRVIAAIHAGWRGTAAKIVVETIAVMQKNFGCIPGDILAAIGPSIGKCCFEVGEEVAQVFERLFPEDPEILEKGKLPGKYQVDLWAANRKELREAGVKEEHIEVARMCSVCHPDQFFSYRREGKKAGRFGAGIMLGKKN